MVQPAVERSHLTRSGALKGIDVEFVATERNLFAALIDLMRR